MITPQEALQRTIEHREIFHDEMLHLMRQIMNGEISPLMIAAILTGLRVKKETIGEISAAARVMRELCTRVETPENAHFVDIVGTGGDGAHTFNISTAAMFVAAAAGASVAKHGNRGVSSKSGSADVLEALGIRVDLSPAEAAVALRDQHFAFIFAPNYHPAFKHIAPARKFCAERKQRTIFNFLGPLLNPIRPTAQLLGVPKAELCAPLARVLQSLGLRRGMVVSGRVGAAQLDELSTLGLNTVAEFYQERGFALSTLDPKDFPLQPATIADLHGGDREVNAEIIRQLLRGADRGPKLDAVRLNAGAGLFLAGRARSLAEGWELVDEIIGSGQAWAKLEQLRSR